MLEAVSPLGGFAATHNDVLICENTGRSIVSIAVPNGGLGLLKTAVSKLLKLDLPEPGHLTKAKTGNAMLVWTSPDQYLYLFDDAGKDPARTVGSGLGSKAYVTDQSDAWACLEMKGGRKLEALERICPIDLHPDKFVVGMAARTMMEHLGVLILRDQPDRLLLLSARSSAQSMLHAVETSAKNLA